MHGYVDDGQRYLAPQHIQEICQSFMAVCDIAPLGIEDITIYVQLLPHELYAYADKCDMSITINTYYCMSSNWFTWLVSFGFPFVFYHELMHLKQDHEFSEDEREIGELYSEMEADLGSFEILLKQKRLITLAFCLSKITLDALLNINYNYDGQPSARERCRYWWGFCKEFITGHQTSYQAYAQLYFQELYKRNNCISVSA